MIQVYSECYSRCSTQPATLSSADRQIVGLGSAGLSHVRAPAAFAAHLPGHEIDQFARLHLGREIGGDPGDQLDLAVFDRGQHDDAGFEVYS